MSNPYIVVFAGANGAGKSTSISNYLDNDPIPYICPDLIAANNYSHISDEYQKYKLAMDDAEFLRTNLLIDKVSFSFETVLSTADKIKFLEDCKKSGYEIYSIYITTLSPDINIQRVRNRTEHGGHDVPMDKIKSRYEKSLSQLPELIKVSDLCLVVDNSSNKLTYEFVKYEDKHLIFSNLHKDLKDFIDKNIVQFLQKEGIKCELLEYRNDYTIENMAKRASVKENLEHLKNSRNIQRTKSKPNHEIEK